ncbi:hypothetical protein ACFWP5_44405 [Streptomyces sp. NPDC058469]|uniref:hypothetical protein n=1 Tax=Streptomyces sp. NPDC058469 TaxID=3346514 RepID=UPI00365667AF
MAHPEGLSFESFLLACLAVTESDGHVVWAAPELLVEVEAAALGSVGMPEHRSLKEP